MQQEIEIAKRDLAEKSIKTSKNLSFAMKRFEKMFNDVDKNTSKRTLSCIFKYGKNILKEYNQFDELFDELKSKLNSLSSYINLKVI